TLHRARFDKSDAQFTESYKEMANPKLRAKALPFLKQQLQVAIICRSRRGKFHAVRRDHIASGIFLVMQAFGVNESGYGKFASPPNNRLAYRITQQTLSIIRKDDCRTIRDLRFDFCKKHASQFGTKFACLFDIQ